MAVYDVADMSCGHCVATIEKSIEALDANAAVTCDLAARTVAVTSAADPSAIVAALDDAGYPAVPRRAD